MLFCLVTKYSLGLGLFSIKGIVKQVIIFSAGVYSGTEVLAEENH